MIETYVKHAAIVHLLITGSEDADTIDRHRLASNEPASPSWAPHYFRLSSLLFRPPHSTSLQNNSWASLFGGLRHMQ